MIVISFLNPLGLVIELFSFRKYLKQKKVMKMIS